MADSKFVVMAYDCKPYYYDNFLCKINPVSTGITFVIIFFSMIGFLACLRYLPVLKEFYLDYKLIKSKRKLEDLEK